jgi:hypothetical protein
LITIVDEFEDQLGRPVPNLVESKGPIDGYRLHYRDYYNARYADYRKLGQFVENKP